MESSYQKFTKDVLVIGGANILNALSGIIFLPLITKTLGASDYGIWSQVQAVMGLILGVVGLGLPYAMSRFLAAKTDKAEIRDEFWSVFTLVFVVTLVVSTGFILLAGWIAQAFFGGATDIVRIAGLIIFITSLNSVFLNLFRALRQMKKYAFFNVVSSYLQIGLITLLVLNGYGIFSMVLSMLAVNILVLFCLFLLIKRQIGFKKPHFTKIKEYLDFGLPTIAGNLSAWVVYSSDRFVISYFLGSTWVGIYSAAYSLGNMPIMISSILGLILPATLSKLYDESKIHELKMYLKYSLKYSLLIAIPFIFGVATLGKPLLEIFATSEIATKGQIILVIEAVNSCILISGGIINLVLVVVKKTKVSGIAWGIASVVNLVLNLILVPRIGILGSALGTMVSYLISQIIQLYYSLNTINLSIDWISIMKSLVSSIIMAIIICLMKPTSFMMTILSILIGCVVYGVSIIMLKTFKIEELSFLVGFIPKRFFKSKIHQ